MVSFVLALISSADRATLMQLLSLEHRRLGLGLGLGLGLELRLE